MDIIPIGFINTFPAQSNGWIGTNYGNACWAGVDDAPGYDGKDNNTNNRLLTTCPTVAGGITVCQAQGKKVLLSLGGAFTQTAGGPPPYDLTGKADGIALANFLWGAYGPYKQSWVAAGNPRPLDGYTSALVADASHHIDIDGFDFDIELPSSGTYF